MRTNKAVALLLCLLLIDSSFTGCMKPVWRGLVTPGRETYEDFGGYEGDPGAAWDDFALGDEIEVDTYTFKGIEFDVIKGVAVDDSEEDTFTIYTTAYPKGKDNIKITVAAPATPDDYTEEKVKAMLAEAEPGFQELVSFEKGIWGLSDSLDVLYSVYENHAKSLEYLIIFFCEDLTYFFHCTERSWYSGDEFIITLESLRYAD